MRAPNSAWPPVRRVTITLPLDVGHALRQRSLREERTAKIEAGRLLRSALVASGDLAPEIDRELPPIPAADE
jgi:hypothetical protein